MFNGSCTPHGPGPEMGTGQEPGTGVYCSHCSTGNGTGCDNNLLPSTAAGGEIGLEPIHSLSLSLCSVKST